MSKVDIEKSFLDIEQKLNDELLGQKNLIHNLCFYFKKQLLKDERGILVLVGERGTFKKASVRLLFEEFKSKKILKGGEVDEIDLASYDFNLGYNAFLTDLYEKLNSDSSCIIFKNAEKANDEILKVLSELYPNTCLKLNHDYVIKNKFLVEADNSDENKIDKFICHDKFFIYIYNDEKGELGEDFQEKFKSNKFEFLYSRALDNKERNILVRRELIKGIEEIQEKLNVDIQLGVNEDNDTEDDFGICTFLQENYIKDGSFGISEYLSYKIYKPITNLIIEERLCKEGQFLLYVKNNEIYCRCNESVFKLDDYLTPTLEEAKYKLDSIIGMKDLKDFIINVENNYKVQKIRKRLGLKTSKISMNMIFEGNAGTGKTNAARVTFEYLNALGILSKGVFREVSKADFVTENINDTAKRTIDIINSAIGGILFIDEAYSLCESEEDKVGKEIVDALLKGIEDNRENLIVILAGYKEDMDRFLSFNPGLKSRFSNRIEFKDYNPVEMYEIAENIAKSKGYKIAKNVKSGLIDLFTRNQLIGKNDLGNARFVRNIIENAILDASKKYLTNSKRQIDLLERDNFNFKINAKFDLEKKLEEIIGLEEVKNLLRSQYKLIVAQEKRKSVGVSTKIEQNLNMVFAGNPGTGKTSIARLVAEMLNSMGLLKIGQLVETDRSSFVSEVPGETSKKTEAKFKEAIGGILFIDEAYTLANDSLGREAIETLLKLIEDYSKEVIVILAGYEEEMEEFFDVNIGLRSRFPLWTNFEDYNPNELSEMAIRLIEAKGFKISKNAYVALKKSFVQIYESSDSQSGNGRMVRNYVESIIRNQSIRIAENDTSVYEMNLINAKDIEKINVSEYDQEFDLEEKLSSLVVNDNIKNFLRNQYKLIKVKDKRRKLGMRSDINKYMNMVFTGEVGTGKKTVLNILSEMYYSMGIVKAKHIVEIDKHELISMMSKGIKLEDIFNKHLGKILFIDKADLLLNQEECKELTSELIKFIDKNNNKIIMVLSGNKEKMKEFVAYNQSLNYRFPIWLDFEGYEEKELFNIALSILEKKGYSLSNKGEEALNEVIRELNNNEKLLLKNGLMIKQYLDILIRAQSIRVADKKLNVKELSTVENTDIYLSKEEFLYKNSCHRRKTEMHECTCKNEEKKNYESSIVSELIKLKNLLDLNVITEEEFSKLKSKLI